MPARPLLMLDVDGVLNPYGYVSVPAGFVIVGTGGDAVVLCPDHAAWIRELGTRLEVVWATAWNEQANTVIAPALGIDTLPVVTMPPVPFPPEARSRGSMRSRAGDPWRGWTISLANGLTPGPTRGSRRRVSSTSIPWSV